MHNLRVLIYTIAVDAPGKEFYRHMSKILVSSLLRTYFTGDILIVHNGTAPVFRVERKGVEEVILAGDTGNGYRLKFEARRWIDAGKYDWVCFLDSDMIALRNIDHLFDPGAACDILWQTEGRMSQGPYNAFFHPHEYPRLWRNGANSGTWAVRGPLYQTVMAEWDRIDSGEPVSAKYSHDQPAWNRLLFDTALRTRRFEKEEIRFPLLSDHPYMKWRQAALLHAHGPPNEAKLEFLMSQYLGRFAGDPPGLMLSLLDP